MNVLEVIPSVNPSTGGPVEWIKQFGLQAMLQGHNVEVASLDSPEQPYVHSYPLKVHACGPGAAPPYLYASRFVPWLRQHAEEFDLVVVNGIWAFHSFGTWLALQGSKTPYVVFPHGMLDPWFKRRYPLKHAKKWLYWPWSEYRVLRDAQAVLFTSEEEKLLARQSFWLYRCREINVGNGTSVMAGDRTEMIRSFYQRFPALEGKRLALFLSRIDRKKGCDLLVRAFAQTLGKAPGWQLVVAGPDPTGWVTELKQEAERLNIAQQITWTGMLNGSAKWGAMMASEVFVLPSHQENFGLVVAEALACGLPALISNKVNIWREIETDGAGIVAPDDLEGTCRLMQRWNDLSPAKARQMGERARLCFEAHFEIGKVTAALLDVMAGVAFGSSVEIAVESKQTAA